MTKSGVYGIVFVLATFLLIFIVPEILQKAANRSPRLTRRIRDSRSQERERIAADARIQNANDRTRDGETVQIAAAEQVADETEIEEVLKSVGKLSFNAAEQVEQQFETQTQTSGKVGSKAGTGSRPLGASPGEGGILRHQRWFIRFAHGSSLNEYAKQLDFFGIELGALFPAQKRLVYVKNFSSKPVRRNVMTGANEKRLYMNRPSGSLRKTDDQLFSRAGINAQGAIILHFYPSSTENLLAKLEKEFRNRNVKTIRRTIFETRKRGKGYRFLVTRQTYLR